MSRASPVNQHLTTIADEIESKCSTASRGGNLVG